MRRNAITAVPELYESGAFAFCSRERAVDSNKEGKIMKNFLAAEEGTKYTVIITEPGRRRKTE